MAQARKCIHKEFFLDFLRELESMDPPCACQWTPPLRKKKHAPPCQRPPPLERRNMARAIDTGGGGGAGTKLCMVHEQCVQLSRITTSRLRARHQGGSSSIHQCHHWHTTQTIRGTHCSLMSGKTHACRAHADPGLRITSLAEGCFPRPGPCAEWRGAGGLGPKL